MADMTLHEAIHTQRAMRHLKPDPVDDAPIEQMIEAATRAPNGGNQQPWHFIVVRDRNTKAKLGVIFDELGLQMAHGAPDRTPWEVVPVLIAICSLRGTEGAGHPTTSEASILPAVQNLLLTARSLGIGTVLTTRWMTMAQLCSVRTSGWPTNMISTSSATPGTSRTTAPP